MSAAFEIKSSTKGFEGGPPMSGAPGPSHELDLDLPVPDSADDMIKSELYSRGMSQHNSHS